MNNLTGKNMTGQQDGAPYTGNSHTDKLRNAVTTVSSFTAATGEFVLWLKLGADVRDERVIQQMVANEMQAWDRDYAEFLSAMGTSEFLLDTYKRIEQVNQAARRAGRAVVVIANYELIESEIQKELIENHMSACRDAITYVLISGQDITVGVRAQSKLHRLGKPYFQLTREDVRIYYTAIGIVLGDAILDRILQITQGESVLVSRLGECLKRWQPLEDVDVSSAVANLSRLFMSEYYRPCPDEHRQLQVLLSLLDDISMEFLCELTTLDIEEVKKLLNDHVLIQFDLERNVYYIQKLYRDFLRNQSPELPKKLKFGFLRKAAQWHEGKGDFLRAVRYYAQCEDYGKMLSPLKKLITLHVDRETSQALLAILEHIPQDEKDKCIDFEMIHCLALFNVLRDREALQGLATLQEKLEKKSRTSNEDAALSDIYLLRALRAWVDGSPEYLTYMIKSSECVKNPSVTHFKEMFRSNLLSRGSMLRFKDMHAGDLMVMKDTCLQAIPYLEKIFPGTQGNLYLAAAEAHLYRMEFDDADLYLGKAIAAAESFQQWDTLCEAYYLLQRIAMATGNLDTIVSFVNQVHNYCHMEDDRKNEGVLRLSQAHFSLYMGLYNRAESWIEQENPKAPTYQQRIEIGRECAMRAMYMVNVQRQYYPAIFFIDQTMPVCYDCGLWINWLQAIIIKAIIYSILGRSTVAARFFTEAYRLSAPNDITFPFVEFGGSMLELLEEIGAIPVDINPDWIKRIKDKTAQYVRNKKIAQEIYLNRYSFSGRNLDKLTGREYLALRHLCNGLSNEEIAEQMKIQSSSVYHYLSMAYKKIGAKSHNDAVRIAVLEGILEMHVE